MNAKILNAEEIKKLLPKREKDVCKTDFGHVLVIAGSRGMSGAAVLAARAALRIGVGLVTVGCSESMYPIVASQVPELMTLPLPETKEQTLNFSALKPIREFIKKRKVSSLAIGPGLSTHPETVKLVNGLLLSLGIPIVLDADGVNALATQIQNFRHGGSASGTTKFKIQNLVKAKAKIIITPHPGEFGRLIKEDKEKIQKNRAFYARNFARENKVICVLKGYKTVITDGKEVFINPTGNPGMATAGSGDVLTGMTAGLIGQMRVPLTLGPLPKGERRKVRGDVLFNAAKIGVYLHGLAGDLAAKEKTEMGIIAGDIIEKIPDAIRTVKKL